VVLTHSGRKAYKSEYDLRAVLIIAHQVQRVNSTHSSASATPLLLDCKRYDEQGRQQGLDASEAGLGPATEVQLVGVPTHVDGDKPKAPSSLFRGLQSFGPPPSVRVSSAPSAKRSFRGKS
jgi:hypothetical protein